MALLLPRVTMCGARSVRVRIQSSANSIAASASGNTPAISGTEAACPRRCRGSRPANEAGAPDQADGVVEQDLVTADQAQQRGPVARRLFPVATMRDEGPSVLEWVAYNRGRVYRSRRLHERLRR